MQTVPVTPIGNPHQCTKFVRHSYASLTSRVLGILQIIFGFLLIVLQCVAIGIYAGPYYVGHGIWTGISMIIAGAFGIAAANFKSTGTIFTSMVLSIIAASFTSIPLVLSIIGIAISHDKDIITMGRCDKWWHDCVGAYSTRVSVNILMLILSLLEIAAAIWASVLGCKEMCVTRPDVEGTQRVAMMDMTSQASQQSTCMVNMPQAQQTTPVFMQQGTPIQSQQAIPVAMQQGTPIQSQQAIPVAMQQGTPIQTQQTFPVTMQQGTPIQKQQAMPVAMQQGPPIQIQQTPMVMQQGMPVLIPNGQQFSPTITQQGQQGTPVAMQQSQQFTPVAVTHGQQVIPVLMPLGQLANVHSEAANTRLPSNNSTQMTGAVEQTAEPQLPKTEEKN